VKFLQSNPNIVHLPNGKSLNFESFGTVKTKDIFESHRIMSMTDPNNKFYNERQLAIYLKFKEILEGIKLDQKTDIVNKIGNSLLNIFIRKTYAQSLDALTNVNFQSDTVATHGIQSFREQLKTLFNMQNIIVAFNDDNLNLFDIYLDSVVEPTDLTVLNPLDFSVVDNYIKFVHPSKLNMTVFISPKFLKEIVFKYVASIKSTPAFAIPQDFDNLINNDYDLKKMIMEYFTVSLITAIIKDTYREVRVNHINAIFNIWKLAVDNKMNDAFNEGLGGWDLKNKDIRIGFYNTLENEFQQLLNTFHMHKGASCYEHVSPGFYDCVIDIICDIWPRSDNINANPLILSQIMLDLQSPEINDAISKLTLINNTKETVKLSTLLRNKPGSKQPVTDCIRNTLGISRIIPLLYFSPYILGNGIQFKTVELMLNEIRSSMDASYAASSTSIEYSSLQQVIKKVLKYEQIYGAALRNPLNTGKKFINFIFMFLKGRKD